MLYAESFHTQSFISISYCNVPSFTPRVYSFTFLISVSSVVESTLNHKEIDMLSPKSISPKVTLSVVSKSSAVPYFPATISSPSKE